jgi:hypothetical protein
MMNQIDLEALRNNYDPRKGPQSVDEWLYLGGNSTNVLNNLAIANARLANAIAKSLNNQKNLVEEVANIIEVVANLKTDIDAFKPANPDFGQTSKLGKTIEEARSLVQRLKAQVELPQAQKEKIETSLNKNEIPELDNKDYNILSTVLMTRTETLTTISQQESLRLQTLTTRYTQGNDQAGTVQQKDAQSKDRASANLRGA